MSRTHKDDPTYDFRKCIVLNDGRFKKKSSNVGKIMCKLCKGTLTKSTPFSRKLCYKMSLIFLQLTLITKKYTLVLQFFFTQESVMEKTGTPVILVFMHMIVL